MGSISSSNSHEDQIYKDQIYKDHYNNLEKHAKDAIKNANDAMISTNKCDAYKYIYESYGSLKNAKIYLTLLNKIDKNNSYAIKGDDVYKYIYEYIDKADDYIRNHIVAEESAQITIPAQDTVQITIPVQDPVQDPTHITIPIEESEHAIILPIKEGFTNNNCNVNSNDILLIAIIIIIIYYLVMRR